MGKNKRIERRIGITKDLILTGKSVASNVKGIAKLIARGSAETTDALIPSGVVNATTTIFGETATVSRAVSKAAVVTSGRIFSGAFTIVVGGATVVYGKSKRKFAIFTSWQIHTLFRYLLSPQRDRGAVKTRIGRAKARQSCKTCGSRTGRIFGNIACNVRRRLIKAILTHLLANGCTYLLMPGWGQTLDQRVARPCQAVARGHPVSARGKGHFSDSIRFKGVKHV